MPIIVSNVSAHAKRLHEKYSCVRARPHFQFAMFYSHAKARSKLPKKRRRILQPHEIKPIVGRTTTAALLGTLTSRAPQNALTSLAGGAATLSTPTPSSNLFVQSTPKRKSSRTSLLSGTNERASSRASSRGVRTDEAAGESAGASSSSKANRML